MDPGIVGALISGGSSLLGSLFGGGETQSAGDIFKSAFKAKMKMGEKYGISKLVMAGANAGASPWESAGSGLGEAIGSMGQDIGRAIATRQTGPQRFATRLALEGSALDNELKRAQIRSMNMRTVREAGPPRPMIPIPRPKPGSPASMYSGMEGHKIEDPVHTSGYTIFGKKFTPNPFMSDGSVFTNLAGEPSEYVTFPLWLGQEMGWQMGLGANQFIDWSRKNLHTDRPLGQEIYNYLLRQSGAAPGPVWSPAMGYGGGYGW